MIGKIVIVLLLIVFFWQGYEYLIKNHNKDNDEKINVKDDTKISKKEDIHDDSNNEDDEYNKDEEEEEEEENNDKEDNENIDNTDNNNKDINNQKEENTNIINDIPNIENDKDDKDTKDDNYEDFEDLSIESKENKKLIEDYKALLDKDKGDQLADFGNLEKAKKSYLDSLKKNPDDLNTKKKLSEIEYQLGNYDESEKILFKVYDKLNKKEREKYIKILLMTTNFENNESKVNLKNQKIKKINIDSELKEYYIGIINCTIDFYDCKKKFEKNGFGGNNKIVIDKKLKAINKAFLEYNKFGLDENYYKDFLIIKAIFDNGDYPISNYLGKKLIENKKGYKPIIGILGKGYYEVGNYRLAKYYLGKFNEIEEDNSNIKYLLGNIFFKEKDYSQSNIFLKSSISAGFPKSIIPQRMIVYNNLQIGNGKEIFYSFDNIMKNKNATIGDFLIGIMYAIINKEYNYAEEWSQKGLANFNGNNGYENFYGYLGWVNRVKYKNDKALDFLEKGKKINENNPLINLNFGYLYEIKKDYKTAAQYFLNTVKNDNGGIFGDLANDELKKIYPNIGK